MRFPSIMMCVLLHAGWALIISGSARQDATPETRPPWMIIRDVIFAPESPSPSPSPEFPLLRFLVQPTLKPLSEPLLYAPVVSSDMDGTQMPASQTGSLASPDVSAHSSDVQQQSTVSRQHTNSPSLFYYPSSQSHPAANTPIMGTTIATHATSDSSPSPALQSLTPATLLSSAPPPIQNQEPASQVIMLSSHTTTAMSDPSLNHEDPVTGISLNHEDPVTGISLNHEDPVTGISALNMSVSTDSNVLGGSSLDKPSSPHIQIMRNLHTQTTSDDSPPANSSSLKNKSSAADLIADPSMTAVNKEKMNHSSGQSNVTSFDESSVESKGPPMDVKQVLTTGLTTRGSHLNSSQLQTSPLNDVASLIDGPANKSDTTDRSDTTLDNRAISQYDSSAGQMLRRAPAVRKQDSTSPIFSSSTLAKGYRVYSKPPGEVNSAFLAPIRVDDMVGLVIPKGYGMEQHDIVTSDGYIISNFRIPRANGDASSPPGPPVLLLHGISLSSTCWVINQPDQSLAFILADKGYDVWMTNTRGNTFSNRHVKYSNKDSKYWAFSADEMALIDLPATLDYILQVTGYKQLSFVGHSQGATLMLMLLSTYHNYNSVISVNVDIAPVVFVKFVKSPALISFFTSTNGRLASTLLPPQQFFYMSPTIQTFFLDGACQILLETPACVLATESMFGRSSHITTLQYMRYWQAWPSATSKWNALQWAQMYNEPTPRFFKFNYGPDYNLSNVKAPTVLFSAGQDVLSSPQDIEMTGGILSHSGSLVEQKQLPDYGHMDFIWDSQGAKTRVYPDVLKVLQKYPSQA